MPMMRRPNFRATAARMSSLRLSPPDHTSVSPSSASLPMSLSWAMSYSIGGTPFHTVAPVSRSQATMRRASRMSEITAVPPAWLVSSVDSTSMFRIVIGRLSALRSA